MAPAAAPSWTRDRSDPAGGTGDEQGLAGAEPGLGEEGVEGGGGGLHEPAGGLEVHVFWDGDSRLLVGEGELGLSGAADESHHPVADLEPGRLRSRPPRTSPASSRPGMSARGCRPEAGRSRPSLEQVGPIEPGSPNRHKQLVVAGNGVRVLGPLEAAVRCDRDGAHPKR